MPENEEPLTTLKFATAKAELKELIENLPRGMLREKPDINSFSSSVIDDLVPPEFISRAEFWWKDTGKQLWKEEINKRAHLYFDPYAIAFLAGWVGTLICTIFFPDALFTFSFLCAFVVGGFYGGSIRKMAITRFYERLRTTFLSSLINWKAEKLVRKYPEFLFNNLEDLSDRNVLKDLRDNTDFLAQFITRK